LADDLGLQLNFMTKAILFDLDGVVITGNSKRFSERLSEKLGLPLEAISEFFTGDFRECSFGRADLKQKIAPYLARWRYEGTVDDLLKFWFENEGVPNDEVLKIIADLRSKGIRCFIATRQEKYRKEYLLNSVGLGEKFDGIFCTCDIGYDKSERGYWDYVFKELDLKPEEIMFFCDRKKNVETAESLGIQAYLYEGPGFLKENLKALY
jgi:putative hydrolase of the HAD superfamily